MHQHDLRHSALLFCRVFLVKVSILSISEEQTSCYTGVMALHQSSIPDLVLISCSINNPHKRNTTWSSNLWHCSFIPL